MDKILVFTNYDSGYQGLPAVKKIDDWYDLYPDESHPIVLCLYDDQIKAPLLQSVSGFPNEGIYLVFDKIESSLLDKFLCECEQKNDRICVLTHSRGNYADLSYFNKWNNVYPLRGMHIEGNKYWYEPVFDIIINPYENNKLNRIINTIFLPEVIQNFLSECLVPNKNLRNTTSYHFLSHGGFENALGSFLDKYESSNIPQDYKEDYTKLKKTLLMGTKDINSL